MLQMLGLRCIFFSFTQLNKRRIFLFRKKIYLFRKKNKVRFLNSFVSKKIFFFYLGFLSQPSTNHRTAGEGGGHFFNSSLPLPPTSQTLTHYSQAITAESSPLHKGSSWTQTRNLWFPGKSH